MDRPALAARILKTDGALLLVVALIHFAATPFALRFVSSQSTPEAFVQIGPPFLLSFIVVGILLIPIGLSTVYSADSFRSGERWARVICGFNALAVFLFTRSPGDGDARSIFSSDSIPGCCDTGMDRRNLYDLATPGNTFWLDAFNQTVARGQ